MILRILSAAAVIAATACSNQPAPDAGDHANEHVNLRNLIDTEEAGARPARLKVAGDAIPTRSDRSSRYFLLRTRATAAGPIVSIIRQERGDKVVYARTETDCARRLFHVVGTADRRSRVETDQAHDGPLRPIAGLPLREELARFICERSNQPLAAE